MKELTQLFKEHQQWAQDKFPVSTPRSSLKGLKRESSIATGSKG